MKEQIVAVTVDKIQTFLTQAVHSHVQEKQTEDATLKEIRDASYQISNGFFEEIQKIFPETNNEFLLACSGVYIFKCIMPESEIEQRLNELFIRYYLDSQGQKQIRWTCFPASGNDNITSIQKAKERLRQSDTWNQIIEKNKELLFQFHEIKGEQKTCWDKEEKALPLFAGDINGLYQRKEEEEKKNRFRIAVLKADLNGMGEMFKKIQDYKRYRTISEILNEEISLDGLHHAAEKHTPKGKKGWLFPFYIAGDDIFFAVAIEDLICGIDVCREIMQRINQRMETCDCGLRIGISIGVEITINRQPIRYYMDMVETQLQNAKSKKVLEVLKPFYMMKISVGNLVFFDVDYGKIKNHKQNLKSKREKEELETQMRNVPIWSYFHKDLKLLNYIRKREGKSSELLGRPNFFYTLLQDITEESVQSNPVRYMNHVLYHLFPKYGEDGNRELREWEQILNYHLILPLYQKKDNERKLVLNQETKQWFEGYLRLMVLFSDVRFQIRNGDEQSLKRNEYKKEKNNIERFLFSKPRNYLYETCLMGTSQELTGLFAVLVYKEKLKKGGYLRPVIEKSLLFRLRNVDEIPLKKAAEMIKLFNPLIKEKVKEFNDTRLSEGKAPNRLYFDTKKFCRIAAETGAWTPDFIDSLMLFYQYNDKVMELKKPLQKRRTTNE